MNALVANAEFYQIETLRWSGRLPRFASLREGGPGKPMMLMICFGISVALGWWGVRLIDRQGIDSSGPAMLLIAACLACFLVFWLLIKVVLRSLEVSFSIDKQGVEVNPSKKQQTLDRRMRFVSLVTFWLTFKGGQWSRWHPLTPWKQVRSVEIDRIKQEVLLEPMIVTARETRVQPDT
jgi:hypothetical protein